jgi:ribosomal protein S18 acetylase RimI-like enzyme
MQIRPAKQSDCPAIVQIHVASWRSAYRGALTDAYLEGDIATHLQRQWQNRLSDTPVLESGGEQIILVAEDNGELLGFACAYLNEDPQWGSFLNNIHVKQATHRRGVGTALLRAVATRCTASISGVNAAAGAKQHLYLFVIQANLAAQRFYTRHGAQNVGVDMWDAPDGGRVPLYRFAWADAKHLVGA